MNGTGRRCYENASWKKRAANLPPLAGPSEKGGNRGLTKRYLKSRPSCKVFLRLPREAAPGAQCVTAAGDFNNWDHEKMLMKRLGNGDFSIILELQRGREYRSRYLVDNRKWENDWFADKYAPNSFCCDDSVVIV